MVQPARPLMKIWPMPISRWVPQSTNTISEYVILIVFPQQLLHEGALMCRYTYNACLVQID